MKGDIAWPWEEESGAKLATRVFSIFLTSLHDHAIICDLATVVNPEMSLERSWVAAIRGIAISAECLSDASDQCLQPTLSKPESSQIPFNPPPREQAAQQ